MFESRNDGPVMELHYMEGYIRGVMSEMTLLLNVLAECLLHMIG